ncbi:hypothetical protein ACH5RR_027055 [Cinchona calisaya]|uniref:Homeobox domain-containing protein n=1 Tax=Cinchona calisaya TaxID=153742 RepID=A0ABD2Z9C1_9GENT
MVLDTTNICNTRLSLGLPSTFTTKNHNQNHLPQFDDHHDQDVKNKSSPKFDHHFSLTLGLPSEQAINNIDGHPKGDHQSSSNIIHGQQAASSVSAVSSFSNSSVKREREVSGEEVEEDRVYSKNCEDQDEEGPRKKLRLTKEQSLILEDSFKEHSTLNPKQKQSLANRLNLRPRQVEVWFQNRRARTKLKQTEVDCELLKKCCETLKEENRRLHKELQEIKAMKLAAPPPLYMQIPAATLSMCPSCERISGGGGGENSSKISFSIGPKPHFYSPFTNHPSAAC